jgi:tape measure domain-containing protein
MGTENIDIVVNKTGDVEAAQGIANIGTSAVKTSGEVEALQGTMEFLKGALEGVIGAFGIGTFLKFAEAAEAVDNKLRLVATSAQNFTEIQDALFAASQRSHSSFEANAEVYQKLALQAGQIGLNTKEIIPLIETLNKAMDASGATSEQAKIGMQELTRGLELGSFSSRNFLQLFRQVPFVAEQVARGMGVTVQELQKLAASGQLTTRQFADALTRQTGEIDRAFGATSTSISTAFLILQNALVRFVGEANNTTGITKVLAEGIILLANNINTAATAVAIATGIFTLFKVAASIVGLINTLSAAFIALDIAVAPLLISLVAIAAAIAGAVVLYERFSGNTKDLSSQVKDLGAKYLGLGETVTAVATSMDGNYKVIIDRQKQFDKENDEAFKAAQEATKKWEEENKKQFAGYMKDMDDAIKKQQEMERFTRNAFGDMIEVTSEWARRSGEYFNEVKASQDGFNASLTKSTDTTVGQISRIEKAANSATSALKDLSYASVTAPDDGEFRRFAGTQGYDPSKLIQDINSASTLYGTPLGGQALQTVAGDISGVPPAVLSYLKANYGYLFSRITSGGYGNFAGGGSFDVGGSGGVDSQLVQFHASPDERVIIQTPAQQQQSGRAIIVHMPIQTADAGSFKRSQPQILMALEAKLRTVAGRLG